MAATIVTACLAVGSAATATAAVPTPPAACATTFNLFIPGTWETDETADPAQPRGMLGPVAEAVRREHGADSDIYFVPYMARAFDNGYTYADSKSTAVNNAQQVLRDYSSRCPAAEFTISGYSQGADAAGDLASEIGNDQGPVPADRVLAVGLLADPGAGTSGESVVGPPTPGTGIADPRPQGMGSLAGRVFSICHPGDLYCSIQKGDNPLLGYLGSILGKTLSGGDNSRLAQTLTSDFSKADLAGTAGTVGDLDAALTTPGGIELSRLRDSADKLADTIDPLAELLGSGAAGPATLSRLTAAPAGTAENDAGQVLTTARQSDLSGAVSTVRTIADTAGSLLSTGVRTLQTGSAQAVPLTTAADRLGTLIAPLVATPADTLAAAAGTLSGLKPAVLVQQTIDAVAKIGTLDIPGILSNLALLPKKVAALDAPGALAVAGQLAGQFKPLLGLANAVDPQWLSQILSMFPGPCARLAAAVTSLLSQVDTSRIAEILDRIQQHPDPADLASAGLDLLTDAAQQIRHIDLTGVITAFTAPAEHVDPIALIDQGLSAADFFASGVHADYGSLVVDKDGRNAIQWLGDQLNLEIGHAG